MKIVKTKNGWLPENIATFQPSWDFVCPFFFCKSPVVRVATPRRGPWIRSPCVSWFGIGGHPPFLVKGHLQYPKKGHQQNCQGWSWCFFFQTCFLVGFLEIVEQYLGDYIDTLFCSIIWGGKYYSGGKYIITCMTLLVVKNPVIVF